MRALLDDWSRRVLPHVPAWLPRTLTVTLVALPVLALLSYGVVQTFVLPEQQALEPLAQDRLYTDSDTDSLPDLLENYVYGTDPNASRTASRVVPDGYLARHGSDPSDPAAEESWAAYPGPGEAPDRWGPEGLDRNHRVTVREIYLWDRPDDWDENVTGPWDNGLDPRSWRTPGGLPLPWLLTYGLDPKDPSVGEQVLSPKPGGDGLTVVESYESATDPRRVDTDGDGLDDDRELSTTGTDPSRFDTAGGGVADGWAIRYGLDVADPLMPNQDPDRDGLSNAQEFNASVERYGLDEVLNGTSLDPTRRASAGAPIPDGWLVRQGLDPFEPGVAQRQLQCASDFDGARDTGELDDLCLTVLDAYLHHRPSSWDEARSGPWMGGLSPRTNDTDGDGIPDAVELRGWIAEITASPALEAEPERTHVTSDPLSADTDRDGLTDGEEYRGQLVGRGGEVSFPPTDPANGDTDFDGLGDGREILVIARELGDRFDGAQTLDPVSRDTDGDGLGDGREWEYLRARAARCQEGGDTYGYTNPTTRLEAVLAEVARSSGAVVPPGSDGHCELLEPWGDPDADGAPSILDDDADGDGLLDGWEVDPILYNQSPYASEHARSRTDPVNPDSDGDRLPDAWEVKHARWDFGLQAWNLDPAQWSSFFDDTSDADRDLDGDSVVWYSYRRTSDGYQRQAHTFEATNLVEYRNDTHPNKASTPDHGLQDGWTIFWGRVYPTLELSDVGALYPGAPGPLFLPPEVTRPSLSTGADTVLVEDRVDRFSTDPATGPDEVLVQTFSDVPGSSGSVHWVQRDVLWTLGSVQEHGTNPYMEDTDGDGAPDWWEATRRGGQHPDPVVHEAEADPDEDGLPLVDEFRQGTDPNARDTDLGGASDGDEVAAGRNPLDPLDDASVNDPNADFDCDGVTDAKETGGWEHPTWGNIRTPALTPDADQDGLLDGFDRTIPADDPCLATLEEWGVLSTPSGDGGVTFLGEASWEGDPEAWSTAGDGVSDGYRAHWGMTATQTVPHLEELYTAGRPPWWDEPRMGPWLWGPSPTPGDDVDGDGRPDTRIDGDQLLLTDPDLDNDGLHDDRGEDPTPGGGGAPAPAEGWPTDQGLTAKEVRFRAAHFGPVDRTGTAAADRDNDGTRDLLDRAPTAVRDLQVEGATSQGDQLLIDSAATYNLTGRVVAVTDDGQEQPVANATVLVQLDRQFPPHGAAFTNASGWFNAPFHLGPDHRLEVPRGLTLLGATGASRSWTTPAISELGAGHSIRAVVTNTSGAALPSEPTYLGLQGRWSVDGQGVQATASGIQASASDPIPVVLTTVPQLDLEVPRAAAGGQSVTVTATLTDSGGGPLADQPITITAFGADQQAMTGQDGRARANLTVPTGPPATLTVEARFGGGEHVEETTAQTSLDRKDAIGIFVGSLTPSPAVEGTSVVLEGALQDAPVPPDHQLVVELGGQRHQVAVDDDGTFRQRLPLPPGLVGTVEVEITSPATNTTLAGRAQATVQVLGSSSLALSMPEQDLSPGQTITLRARLTGGGSPLTDRRVQFEGFPGEDPPPARTDAEGVVEATWTAPTDPGTWSVAVSFAGDDRRGPAQDEAFVSVSQPTRIELEPPESSTRGSVEPVTGRLLDQRGRPLAGQLVALHVANATAGEVLTGPDGTFEHNVAFASSLPLGPVTLSAHFNGSLDGRYGQSTAQGRTLVEQGLVLQPRTLSLQRTTNPISLHVRLDDGRAPPPGTLRLSIPVIDHRDEVALDGDRASFQVPVPPSTPLGNHSATVRLDPNGPIPATEVVTVARVLAPTRLTVEVSDAVARGGALALGGQVRDDLGVPVDGGVVELQFLGNRVTAPVSGGQFNATVAVPAEAEPGAAPLTVRFLGVGPYQPTGTSEQVLVRKSVSLDLALPDSFQPGQLVEGVVQLTDDGGDPVVDTEVLLTTSQNVTYLVTTDAQGRATLLLQPATNASMEVQVAFAGSQQHAPAHGQARVQAQAASPSGQLTPWVLGTLAAVALVALALYLLHHRRRALVEETVAHLDHGRRQLMAGNEYEAVIRHTYQALIEMVRQRSLDPRDQETLLEFQDRVQRALGVELKAMEDLFTLFDKTLYGPGEPTRADRDKAITTFHRVAQALRSKLPST